MEDRYLFRGKTISGKWVRGLLANKNGKWYISNKAGAPFAYEIRSETICQCARLRDDHKNMIFKNDILSLKDEINEIEWKAVVKFGNPNGEYTWGWQLVPVGEFEGNKDILLWIETEMEYMQCEVIGNVIDNPELLE